MNKPKINKKDLRCPECFSLIATCESEDGKTRTSTCENGHRYPTFFIEQEARRRLHAIMEYKLDD